MGTMKEWSAGEIKRLLKRAKVSLEAASKVLGLSKDGLERLDNASMLSLEMLQTLGHHYDLPITGLSGSSPTMKKDDLAPSARLRQARDELGLSQAEFGEKIGLTQAGVSKFEMDQIPLRKLVLLAIEHVYSIRREWLVYGEEPKHLSKKALINDDIEILKIASRLKPDDHHIWREMGKCFLSVRWDGKGERRKTERRYKAKK